MRFSSVRSVMVRRKRARSSQWTAHASARNSPMTKRAARKPWYSADGRFRDTGECVLYCAPGFGEGKRPPHPSRCSRARASSRSIRSCPLQRETVNIRQIVLRIDGQHPRDRHACNTDNPFAAFELTIAWGMASRFFEKRGQALFDAGGSGLGSNFRCRCSRGTIARPSSRTGRFAVLGVARAHDEEQRQQTETAGRQCPKHANGPYAPAGLPLQGSPPGRDSVDPPFISFPSRRSLRAWMARRVIADPDCGGGASCAHRASTVRQLGG